MENSFFNVRHVTQFRYNAPVREAVMELYLQPRTDDRQRLRTFEISIAPHGQLFGYSDYMGNAVYHFDVPTAHDLLEIVMQATVEVTHAAALPDTLEGVSWTQAREVATDHDRWEMTQNSQFARPSEALLSFIGETGLSASGDVLTALRTLTQTIYDKFRYVSDATSADSPIEEALASGEGVCQDFAHIMIAVVRQWGLAARYVSGYLRTDKSLGDQSSPDATHAWMEVFLPDLGWIGFDPTNNCIADNRHIRVAIGRDYADVPPTRGVFRGASESELAVAVSVSETDAPKRNEDFLRVVRPKPRRGVKQTAKRAPLDAPLQTTQQ